MALEGLYGPLRARKESLAKHSFFKGAYSAAAVSESANNPNGHDDDNNTSEPKDKVRLVHSNQE